ncbi:phospholipase D family protein [Microvirga pakistanensis]|uniref:phospholipase D family protein n=1 Tax=Microvirga pakistanensis TaxID=1682650 RepID=UPI00106D1F35|nr:phospholipase D family protein [Microvirga pakistanensis]
MLTDIEGYRSSLSDAGAVGVGRSYDIVPISTHGGVFHPKVTVLTDSDNVVRAAIGSGNLTFGGWGYNTEVLDILIPGEDSRAYGDLAMFLEGVMALTGSGQRLEATRKPDLSQFVDACRRASLVSGSGSSRVLHTLFGPLDEQVAGMADELGGAVSLTVVSPFFSSHHGVERLAVALGCENVAVAVPPIAPSIFDFAGARRAGLEVTPVTCETFSDTRSLHAKVFDIACQKGRLLVSGSGNATTAALSGANVEAMVARIVDRSTSLGWRPSGTHEGAATGERSPDATSSPCIVAHFDGREIIGRVFGVPNPSGDWIAYLSSGTRKSAADIVAIGPSGSFRCAPPKDMDPITLSASAQVILERDDVEVRGWLMLEKLLDAIREKGPVARSVARMLSGSDTPADVAAVLEYLAQNPSSLIKAAERQEGGRVDRSSKRALPEISISADQIAPVSAFDMPSTWSGGRTSTAFDSLLDALVRHFANSIPGPTDDAGDDEDDGLDEAPAKKSTKTTPGKIGKRGQRIPVFLARKAFDNMFTMLKARPVGPERAPGLHVLFDMIIQIAPRSDQPEELTLDCLRRWMSLALGCRTGGEGVDGLDRAAAAIVTKWAMDDPENATGCHAALQRWFGRVLDEDIIRDLEPDPFGLDERRLAPDATEAGWHAAWTSVIPTTTPWFAANALYKALRNGEAIEIPREATADEIDILRRVASGDAKANRVVAMQTRPSKKINCPACHIALSAVQQARLVKHRLASCSNTFCNKVIVDLSF